MKNYSKLMLMIAVLLGVMPNALSMKGPGVHRQEEQNSLEISNQSDCWMTIFVSKEKRDEIDGAPIYKRIRLQPESDSQIKLETRGNVYFVTANNSYQVYTGDGFWWLYNQSDTLLRELKSGNKAHIIFAPDGSVQLIKK